MRGFKRTFTGILAAAMALSMTLSAGSAMKTNAASIVINRDASSTAANVNQDALNKQSYTVYKILDAHILQQGVVSTNGVTTTQGNATYYVTDEAKKNELEKAGFTFSEMAVSSNTTEYIVTNENLTDGAALAESIKKNVNLDLFKIKAVSANGAATTIDELTDGYYLIVSSIGSALIAQTLGNEPVVINEKNVYPTVDKKQKKPTETEYKNDLVKAGVGKTIDYSIDVTIPNNASDDVYVTDIMTDGLELIDNITITGIDSSMYERVTKGTNDTFAFKYKFPKEKINTLSATAEVKFTFSAKVTAAAVKATSKKNTVELDYGEYHITDYVPYEISKTGLLKFDGATATKNSDGTYTLKNDTQKLAGVEFKLVDANGNEISVKANDEGIYYPSNETGASSTVVTNTDGVIIIRGLEDETRYSVIETKALPGYNFSADVTERTWDLNLEDDKVDGNNNLTDPTFLYIANNKGLTLPSTGGIGTTIFYIIGGLLIVAAAVFFVVRRRADAE